MLKTIEGVYRDGTIKLLEAPGDILDETRVLITFLLPSQLAPVELSRRGIDAAQAADLRTRLRAFAEDWERPEMDVYDDYDNARTTL
ncbi:MAG: hypothetical protein WCP31_12550 [Chloroflexales bacterium]